MSAAREVDRTALFALAEKDRSIGNVLADVRAERWRQEAKFPQNYPDGTGSEYAKAICLIVRDLCSRSYEDAECTFAQVLAEEFCEALAEQDPIKLRAELVQVAAVAVKWIEAVDARR